MFRFFFGLLIGLLVGTGGTGYFFSTAGGGDYLLASSHRVQKLEQELQEVSQERDQATKQLETTAARVQDMANKFDELERRFRALEEASPKAAPQATTEQEPTSSTNP